MPINNEPMTKSEIERFKARKYITKTASEDLPQALRYLKRAMRPLTDKEAKKVLTHAK